MARSARNTPATATEGAKAVSYIRVSKQKQAISGLGLEAQQAAVETYAKAHGMTITREFQEIETGTSKRKRVEIYKALNEAKATGATLLIAKLDRLARNVHFISGLMESGVKFVAVDMPQVTPLTLHVLAAVAEQEAKMISTRTRDALAALKARGATLGKPENMNHAAQVKGAQLNQQAAADAYKPLLNYARTLRKGGASFDAIAKQLNADGHKTRTGAEFAPMTVKRLLDRARI